MRAITHIAASTAAAAIAGVATEPSAAVGIFLFGGFIDVDHVTHFVSSGLPANPGAFFHSIFRNEKQLEKKYTIKRGIPSSWLFPVFHCVEFVLLLAAVGILTSSNFLLWGGAGLILHLFMDLRSYPCSPRFFSIIWRFLHRRQLLQAWVTHRSEVHW
jgi:multidrug transporter EmrE-like cation transporter